MAASLDRILVVAPNWIGDALMALPLLAALKRAAPSSRITVLAPGAVARVLTHSTLIDQVIETPFAHGELQLGARLKLGAAMARQQFGTAFVLPNSLKSALIPLFARIPRRLGYVGESRRLVLSRWLQQPARRSPMVAQYLALATLAGIDIGAKAADPLLVSTSSATDQAFLRFGLARDRNTVVFCPGAEYGPAKRWPTSHFARLAELIVHAYPGSQFVIMGGPGDAAAAAELQSHTAVAMVVTAGATSIDEAVALLAGADLVISNDSGLMHVAAALERPLIALYGSTDPAHTPPQSGLARVMWLKLSCSPCFERVCPLGHLRCLNELTAESVFAAIAPGTLN